MERLNVGRGEEGERQVPQARGQVEADHVAVRDVRSWPDRDPGDLRQPALEESPDGQLRDLIELTRGDRSDGPAESVANGGTGPGDQRGRGGLPRRTAMRGSIELSGRLWHGGGLLSGDVRTYITLVAPHSNS